MSAPALLLTIATIALAAAGGAPHAHAQVGEEVPFITTPDRVTQAMLRLAGVGPKDHVIDLGSGDGRIVITAARRFGATGLGVEIVPDLVQRSLDNARRAGVADRAKFLEQDLFKTDLSPASVITMYLLPEVNLQLRPALQALRPGVRVVSHDWDMGDWLPDRTLTLEVPDKAIGREKLSRLHLWVVPARAAGLWCGAQGRQWRLTQRHQMAEGMVGTGREQRAAVGRLDGAALELRAGPDGVRAQVAGDALKVSWAGGAWAGWKNQTLQRTAADRCPD